MKDKIILASRSVVRKKILNKNGINCEVIPSNVDEDQVKESLIKSSSILDGSIMHLIPFSSKIFFLTKLFDARIIFSNIFF